MPPQSLPLIKSEIQQCGCLSTSVVQFQSLREERRERASGCQSSDLRQKGFRIPFQLTGLWFEITMAVAAEPNSHTLLDMAMVDVLLFNLIKYANRANQCCIFFMHCLLASISIRLWNCTYYLTSVSRLHLWLILTFLALKNIVFACWKCFAGN